jgi:hypothetical protein
VFQHLALARAERVESELQFTGLFPNFAFLRFPGQRAPDRIEQFLPAGALGQEILCSVAHRVH